MDRSTLSRVGHAGLPFWSPIPTSLVDAALSALAPPRGAWVLDLGCGDGAMLAHVVARLRGTGVGVDRASAALPLANERPGPLTFVVADAAAYPVDGFDLVLLVGAAAPIETKALDAPRLLVGELVELRAPPPHPLPPVFQRLLGEAAMQAYERHWLANVRAFARAHPEIDLVEVVAAHERLLAAGGLGFRVTGYRSPAA